MKGKSLTTAKRNLLRYSWLRKRILASIREFDGKDIPKSEENSRLNDWLKENVARISFCDFSKVRQSAIIDRWASKVILCHDTVDQQAIKLSFEERITVFYHRNDGTPYSMTEQIEPVQFSGYEAVPKDKDSIQQAIQRIWHFYGLEPRFDAVLIHIIVQDSFRLLPTEEYRIYPFAELPQSLTGFTFSEFVRRFWGNEGLVKDTNGLRDNEGSDRVKRYLRHRIAPWLLEAGRISQEAQLESDVWYDMIDIATMAYRISK